MIALDSIEFKKNLLWDHFNVNKLWYLRKNICKYFVGVRAIVGWRVRFVLIFSSTLYQCNTVCTWIGVKQCGCRSLACGWPHVVSEVIGRTKSLQQTTPWSTLKRPFQCARIPTKQICMKHFQWALHHCTKIHTNHRLEHSKEHCSIVTEFFIQMLWTVKFDMPLFGGSNWKENSTVHSKKGDFLPYFIGFFLRSFLPNPNITANFQVK